MNMEDIRKQRQLRNKQLNDEIELAGGNWNEKFVTSGRTGTASGEMTKRVIENQETSRYAKLSGTSWTTREMISLMEACDNRGEVTRMQITKEWALANGRSYRGSDVKMDKLLQLRETGQLTW